jgi:D-alanyl-D-alanine carboxypeptidase
VSAKVLWPILTGLLLLAAAPRACAQRGNPRVAFEGRTIDAMIADFMEEHRVPGMTLAIVQAPYVSRVVGYGTADAERKLLASPKTLWNVGQMTEAYTAVAVLQLVEWDRMTVDDPIGKHVPGLPAAWKTVTVRHLMAHASGVPDFTAQRGFQPEMPYTPADALALVKGLPLAFEPGTRVANSATDFLLLALAVEGASGVTYEGNVIRHQIARLGLKNTLFAPGLPDVKQEAVEKNGFRHKDFLRERVFIDPTEMATGYADEGGKRAPVKHGTTSACLPCGAVLASAEDISLWDIGLAGELLLKKKESRDFLYHGIKLKDGTAVPAHCGWRFPKHRGLMYVKGDVPGFSCYLSRFTDPSELLCVTLCANKGGLDLSELARRIAGAFDRKLGPPAVQKGIVCEESCYSAETTAARFESALRKRGFEVVERKKGSGPRQAETLLLTGPGPAAERVEGVQVRREADGTVWLCHPPASKALHRALAAAAAHAVAPY